jgi:hypothetical protein
MDSPTLTVTLHEGGNPEATMFRCDKTLYCLVCMNYRSLLTESSRVLVCPCVGQDPNVYWLRKSPIILTTFSAQDVETWSNLVNFVGFVDIKIDKPVIGDLYYLFFRIAICTRSYIYKKVV